MNKLLFILPLLLFGMCKSQDTKTEEITEKDITLFINKSIMIDGTSITFMDVIQDSRCPEGVECVWSGVGEVLITIKDEKSTITEKTILFEPKNTTENEKPFTLKLKTHNLEFISLKPKTNAATAINKQDYYLILSAQKITEK